jgi:hypothetical protein
MPLIAIGQYVEDKKEGYGVFQWADGRMYRGSWKDGKQHGKGTLIDKDGNQMEAEWNEGKRIKQTNQGNQGDNQ